MKTQLRPYSKKVMARRADQKTVWLVDPEQHVSYGGAPGETWPFMLRQKYKNLVHRFKGGGNMSLVELSKRAPVVDVHAAAGGGGTVFVVNTGALEDKTFSEVFSLTYAVLKEVGPIGQISKPDLLMKVSDAFAAEAKTEQSTKSTEEAWQGLLVKGLERKKALLNSPQFKSVGEVAELLAMKEPAIRRRIRECKLIALKSLGTDEYRIPVWALSISPDQTKEIQRTGGEMDDWSLHHFMSTPNSWLNGLRPFELLVAPDTLTSEQLARRREVAQHFGVSGANALLDVVLKALAHEVTEESEV